MWITLKRAQDSPLGRRAGFDRRAHAVVLGLGVTGLGVIRSLGEHSVGVTGLDWERDAPASRSRYCRAIPCPHPTDDPDRLLEVLVALGARHDSRPVLLPTTDAYVLFLSRFRETLRQHFLFALPAPAVVEALVNKRRQYEMAERLGLPIPQTFYPEDVQDLERIKQAVSYPALIKPCFSHLWAPIFGNKGFRVNGPSELEQRFSEVARRGLAVMIQAVIQGPGTQHLKVRSYLDETGRPLGMFTARKIRQYPDDFGVSTLEESARLDEATHLGLAFLRGIGYRGVGSIEFKRDARDGQLKLIELNTRFWQQTIHATRCGVNFPLIAYLDLTGQQPAVPRAFAAGSRWLDAVPDFQTAWLQHRRGELTLRDWAWSLGRVRAFAYFDLRDPGPFLAANDYGLRYARLPLYLLRYPHGRRAGAG